ncbi:hypothetical protein BH10BAC2_BH10BAC2_20090 [soil metagenome]
MKAIIFTLLSAFFIIPDLNGQSTFQKLISSPDGFRVNSSITRTDEGNFILITTTDGIYNYETLSFSLWNRNGDTLWSNIYTDGEADAFIRFASAIQLSDSGYLAAFISTPNSLLEKTSIVLIKFNKLGDVLWSKKL